MLQIFNWVCFISVVILVLDLMLYFCKDAMKICNEGISGSSKVIPKTKNYNYQEKIAK